MLRGCESAQRSMTLKFFVFVSLMCFVMLLRCRTCSVSAKELFVGVRVFGACVVFSQHPPNANQGTGGMKILLRFFTESSTGRSVVTCSAIKLSGV